jgi:hypothetical protein
MWEDEWDAAMPVGYAVDYDWLDDRPILVVSRGWHDGLLGEPLVRFRLDDDDGELYYSGLLVDDDDAMSQDAALSFGMNDAGCTTIKVCRDGKWVQEIA